MTGGFGQGSWDEAYQHNKAPWDIGRPQPAIAHIADNGGFVEPVLDSGCGSGEHALLAASMGLEVRGVDVAQTAIEKARGKARQRGLAAEFLVGPEAVRSGVTTAPQFLLESGNCSPSRAAMPDISICACSGVTPGFNRAMTFR